MNHALVIDDNEILSRAVCNRLKAFGFDSFDRTRAAQQAIDAAAERRPDLIVAGDSIVEGSPVELAKNLARRNRAPMVVITTQSFMLHRQSSGGSDLDGPHLFIDLDEALTKINDPKERA